MPCRAATVSLEDSVVGSELDGLMVVSSSRLRLRLGSALFVELVCDPVLREGLDKRPLMLALCTLAIVAAIALVFGT